MPAELLRLDRVTKRYGGRDALHAVSFSVGTGETVGYLGPNGAGKTTTLRLLCGLTRPDEGAVQLYGQSPTAHHGAPLARVGVLVETPGVVPYVHGADLLEYIATVKGIPTSERHREVRRAAELLGVSDHLDRAIGGLSTGLTRRVLLAGAVLGDPPLLLLDEPTLGLDPAARASLRALLRELRRGGRTILLSTHLLDDVDDVCDRVLFLRDGQLVGDEPVHAAATSGGGSETRVLRFRFLRPVDPASLARASSGSRTWSSLGATEASVSFEGGDAEQADLVSDAVATLGPILSAGPPESDLARRYAALIGRGDDA
ncbi:MAG: ABC transporter ATP-binding protein [Thermoplasmata archaeon]|nr:ABC transporter ATP-binding protein [Thermoplasmata archaeon]